MLPKRLSGDAIDLLMAHEWRRNNVRELRNAVEQMVIAADGEMIRPEHLPAAIAGGDARRADTPAGDTFQEQRAEAERRIIVAALERHDWHITRTAESLGLADHASLLKIMRRLGVHR